MNNENTNAETMAVVLLPEASLIFDSIMALTGKVCLSVDDVAKITSLSVSTVKNLIAEGEIPAFKSNTHERRGSRWVISVYHLALWIYHQGAIPGRG